MSYDKNDKKKSSNKKGNGKANLRVAEAEQRDIGRKIVRIDPYAARKSKCYDRRCTRIIFIWKECSFIELARTG